VGKTMTEKILGRHAGHEMNPGEFAVVRLDLAYVQDGTGPLTVRQIEAMDVTTLGNPGRCIAFLDHASPSPRQELSNDHKLLREFCRPASATSGRGRWWWERTPTPARVEPWGPSPPAWARPTSASP
jgi:3-isopropylmalate/(R)-2-methylmalate dehydratase large subunit